VPKSIIITGSAGLIGSEASRYFASQGYDIVGIDNDLRAKFFGSEASTAWAAAKLREELDSYSHRSIDIRDKESVECVFRERNKDIAAVIHTAAQPSHDWAAKDPITDFDVNAKGTLNLLECSRNFSPGASFVFTSTNKVYGDGPNNLPLVEEESRYELYNDQGEPHPGIDETMSVDQCLHSLFGVSKLSADLLVQEYGRYFDLNTVCFRGGCLTGGGHSGTELHGFLSYLMRCVVTGREYKIFGYGGKQVRDNIHSSDLVRAFHEFIRRPNPAKVYNIGGGRESNCSLLEAVKACETRAGKKLNRMYIDDNRIGDHQWYVSSLARFKSDYPNWSLNYCMSDIFDDIYRGTTERTGVS
jgi:CDP-paratose 2-epimerase